MSAYDDQFDIQMERAMRIAQRQYDNQLPPEDDDEDDEDDVVIDDDKEDER